MDYPWLSFFFPINAFSVSLLSTFYLRTSVLINISLVGLLLLFVEGADWHNEKKEDKRELKSFSAIYQLCDFGQVTLPLLSSGFLIYKMVIRLPW